MGNTKTIRVSEELHARIKAHRKEGETLNDTLHRLIRGPSLLELAGLLDEEEADSLEAAIADSHEAHDEEIERMLEEIDDS